MGAAKHRPHEEGKHALRKALLKTRPNIDVERYVPELYSITGKEAIMDLVVSYPGSARSLLIDVTVRSPEATNAQRKVGASGEGGVRDKLRRYGPTVLPLAISHLGRMPAQARQAIREIAAESRVWSIPRLGAQPGIRASYL